MGYPDLGPCRPCRECGDTKRRHGGHGFCVNCYARLRPKTSDRRQGKGPNAKLTPEQCAEIKRLHAGFKTNRVIATKLGVSERTVYRVLSGTYPMAEAS